jgi:hypothetical protein
MFFELCSLNIEATERTFNRSPRAGGFMGGQVSSSDGAALFAVGTQSLDKVALFLMGLEVFQGYLHRTTFEVDHTVIALFLVMIRAPNQQ